MCHSFALAMCIVLLGQNAEVSLEAMIARLASQNQPPQDQPPWRIPKKAPPGFSSEKQQAVYTAIDKLIGSSVNGLEVVLAQRIGDRRYSVSEDRNGDGIENLSVGNVCVRILECRIEVYEDLICREDAPELAINFPPQSFVETEIADPRKRDNWVKKHRESSLLEIQVEAARWTLARERKINQQHGVGCPEKLEEFLKILESRTKPLPPLKHTPFHRF